YGAHSANLEAYSAGFPLAASTQINGEIVKMVEHSDVLKLLLQYMHNERQPDSSEIRWRVLAPLAEAVEKYMVFSAMEVFTLFYGREALPKHPLDVLCYAVKHGYPKLSKMAAPLTLSTSLHDVSAALADRPDIILKWTQYREHWLLLLKYVYEKPPKVLHRGGLEECDLWVPFHRRMLLEIEADISKLREFDIILLNGMEDDLDECNHCQTRVSNWRSAFGKRLKEIPSFNPGMFSDADIFRCRDLLLQFRD
ncbi:hypothetical protein M413DRAFT_77812, partial [Hebeloma cylindrosporum]